MSVGNSRRTVVSCVEVKKPAVDLSTPPCHFGALVESTDAVILHEMTVSKILVCQTTPSNPVVYSKETTTHILLHLPCFYKVLTLTSLKALIVQIKLQSKFSHKF